MADFNKARDVDMQDLVEGIVGSLLDEVHVALPGRVEKYYYSTDQKVMADVTPMVVRVFLDEDDNEVPTPYPMISDVPVLFPGGGGGFLSFPLAAGDLVLLVMTQRSLDNWKESDGKKALDPGDSRRHHISDAIAIPGLCTPRAPLAGVSATDVTLATGGKKLLIGTGTADKALALAEVCNARLNALESFAPSHIHTAPAFGGPTTTAVAGFTAGGGDTSSTRVFSDA